MSRSAVVYQAAVIDKWENKGGNQKERERERLIDLY